jgi:hypothetical protein
VMEGLWEFFVLCRYFPFEHCTSFSTYLIISFEVLGAHIRPTESTIPLSFRDNMRYFRVHVAGPGLC